MIPIKFLVVGFAFTTVLLWQASSPAASFDCASASTTRERLICSTPLISKDDTALNIAYHAAEYGLSPAGQVIIRNGQRSWLKYLTVVCPVTDEADAKLLADTLNCLHGEYQARIKSIASSAMRIGPYVFASIQNFRGGSMDGAPGSGERPGKHYLSYPQIDSPVDARTERWNEIIRQSFEGRHSTGREGPSDDSDCDNQNDYTVTAATADMISVAWNNSYYCQGAPHGWSTVTAQTIILSPEPRALTPTDIFRDDVPWQDRFAVMIRGQYEPQAEPGGDLDSTEQRAIAKVASDPSRWEISKTGITLLFFPYELGSYALPAGVEPIQVSWDELKTLLSPTAIRP